MEFQFLVIFFCVYIFPFNLKAEDLRIATFNTSLYRAKPGQLTRELESGNSLAASKVAQIIQIVRPDVILLNEFDFDEKGKAVAAFKLHYLEKPQGGKKPIHYRYHFAPRVNTGVASGHDLDNDGKTDGPGDAFGFGRHPGQYGLVVLSRFPIDAKQTRTFQGFLWKDMPRALVPRNRDGTPFYSVTETKQFRLSSKNHCDVVLRVAESDFHFLVSHPTPPVFDGQEDRNGKRNHDEIRFWNDYVTPGKAGYIYDDEKRKGGLKTRSRFVIAGDLNADPHDGASTSSPTRLLQSNPSINFKVEPKSKGAVEASRVGAANGNQQGDPALDTANFSAQAVGNLRVDYVLPSANLEIHAAGVFWPMKNDPESDLIGVSDHRLVWIDVLAEKTGNQGKQRK